MKQQTLLLLLTTVTVINSETMELGERLHQAELIDDVSSGMNSIFNSPVGGKLPNDTRISSSGGGRATNNTEEVCRCWDAKFDLNVSTFLSLSIYIRKGNHHLVDLISS